MAINEDDIIYVLTKEDVDGVAKSIGLFCGDPVYDWENAITEALKDAEEELRGGHSGPKPEE